MQNSMGMFAVLGFIPKYLFRAYLVQIFKFVYSGNNLLSRLIRICRTQWWCYLHLFKAGNPLFWANLIKKMKTVSFRWNLVQSLTQIWRTQWWWSLFLFFNDTPFSGKFFQKIKIVSWSWNLEPRLISLCEIRWWCSIFLSETCFASIFQNIHLAYWYLTLPD